MMWGNLSVYRTNQPIYRYTAINHCHTTYDPQAAAAAAEEEEGSLR
jgi:hypothetical protein